MFPIENNSPIPVTVTPNLFEVPERPSLPSNVLKLIFSHLCLGEYGRISAVNKNWKASMICLLENSDYSDIIKLIREVYNKLLNEEKKKKKIKISQPKKHLNIHFRFSEKQCDFETASEIIRHSLTHKLDNLNNNIVIRRSLYPLSILHSGYNMLNYIYDLKREYNLIDIILKKTKEMSFEILKKTEGNNFNYKLYLLNREFIIHINELIFLRDIDKVKKVIPLIPSTAYLPDALATISCNLTEYGYLKESKKVLKKIPENKTDIPLSYLAIAYAERKALKKSLKLANQIQSYNSGFKGRALIEIVPRMIKKGNVSGVKAVIIEMINHEKPPMDYANIALETASLKIAKKKGYVAAKRFLDKIVAESNATSRMEHIATIRKKIEKFKPKLPPQDPQ